MNRQLLFLVFVIVVCCNDRGKKSNQRIPVKEYRPDSIALRLNNKASRLIGDASHAYDTLKTQLYDSAIFYLNQAIEIDSLYLMPYTNKAHVLLRKDSLQDALYVLSRVETFRPDFAEVIMGQGFILEKMEKKELAHEKYSQAFKVFEERLKDDPKNDKVQSDIAFLYIFLEDKNKAIDEIQNFILENRESKQLRMMEKVIKSFDRKNFVEQY